MRRLLAYVAVLAAAATAVVLSLSSALPVASAAGGDMDAINALLRAADEEENPRIAVGLYQKVLALDPGHPFALNGYGGIIASLGDVPGSIKPLEAACAVDFPATALACYQAGLSHQMLGNYPAAMRHYSNSIRADKTFFHTYIKMAYLLANTGANKEAIQALQTAISLRPEVPTTYMYLGGLLNNVRQFDGAVTVYKRALDLDPANAEAHAALADTLSNMGRPAAAVAHFKRAWELGNDPAAAANAASGLLKTQRELCDWSDWDAILGAARTAVAAAVAADSPSPMAPYETLFLDLPPEQARLVAESWAAPNAEMSRRTATGVSVPAFKLSFSKLEKRPDAVASAAAAAEAKSQSTESKSNGAKKAEDEDEEDLELMKQMFGVDRDDSDDADSGSSGKTGGGDDSETVDLDTLLDLPAGSVAARIARRDREADSELGKASQWCRVAIEGTGRFHANAAASGDALAVAGSRLTAASTAADVAAAVAAAAAADADAGAGPSRPLPLPYANPPALLRDFLVRPLRVGYLSRRLEDYAGARLAARLFPLLDRRRYKLAVYATGPEDHSQERLNIRAGADLFLDMSAATPAQTAARIARDRIDVLIDTDGGHSFNNLATLALRPAPVQVTFMGFAGTTGAKGIVDYIVVDPVLAPPVATLPRSEDGSSASAAGDVENAWRVLAESLDTIAADLGLTTSIADVTDGTPKLSPARKVTTSSVGDAAASRTALLSPPRSNTGSGSETEGKTSPREALSRQLSETPLYLPWTYQPQDNTVDLGSVLMTDSEAESVESGSSVWPGKAPETRAEAGLPETGTVYCSFNRNDKYEPATWSAWMRILSEAPASVLWLYVKGDDAKDNIRAAAAANDVDPARVIFAESRPPVAHLARHKLADVFLDSFYYNAHTTASDALYVGVPVVTFPGRTFASRVAASLVAAAGLPTLAVQSEDEYVALAVKLGIDDALLQRVRVTLGELQKQNLRVPTANPAIVNTLQQQDSKDVNVGASVSSVYSGVGALFDSELFVTAFESALDAAWLRRVCSSVLDGAYSTAPSSPQRKPSHPSAPQSSVNANKAAAGASSSGSSEAESAAAVLAADLRTRVSAARLPPVRPLLQRPIALSPAAVRARHALRLAQDGEFVRRGGVNRAEAADVVEAKRNAKLYGRNKRAHAAAAAAGAAPSYEEQEASAAAAAAAEAEAAERAAQEEAAREERRRRKEEERDDVIDLDKDEL